MTIHLCHQGRNLGDFSKEQVEGMLKGRVITEATLAWTPGLAEWKTVSELLAPRIPPVIPPPPIPIDVRPKGVGLRAMPPISSSASIIDSGSPEAATTELQKLSRDTRLGIWSISSWIGAFLFIGVFVSVFVGFSANGIAGREVEPTYRDGTQLDPQAVAGWAYFLSGGPALFFLVAGLRGVARKATSTILLKRQWVFQSFAREVYVPAIWGTLWRSAVPVFLIASFFAFALDEPIAKVQAFTVTILLYFIAFLFTLDRPLQYKSRIRQLAAILKAPSNSTGTQSQASLDQTSVTRNSSIGREMKWVVGSSLAFTILAITVVSMNLLQGPHIPNPDPTDPIAQCDLGIKSYKRADYASALLWLRKSAEQGNAKAQYNLAVMLQQGIGVPADQAEASTWIRASAKQGYANAQAVLGQAYLEGKLGLLKDPTEAVNWLKSASVNRCASAQLQLAQCYLKGIGVPQNNVKAYAWLSIVLDNADKSDDDRILAEFLRDATKLQLSPTEIDEAKAYIASVHR